MKFVFNMPKLKAPTFNKRSDHEAESTQDHSKEVQLQQEQQQHPPEQVETEQQPRMATTPADPTTPQKAPQAAAPPKKKARKEEEEAKKGREKEDDMRVGPSAPVDSRYKLLELEARMDKLEAELDHTAELMHSTIVRASVLQAATKSMLAELPQPKTSGCAEP